MDGQIENAIKIALEKLRSEKGYTPHVHSARCMHLVGDVLEKGEETIMEIKQSLLVARSPDRILATSKRLILVRPSFWKLYTGHTIFGPTEVSFVPYNHLISVIATRGRLLATVHLRIQGYSDESREMKKEGQITGVRIDDATSFTIFLENVIEVLSAEKERMQGMA